MKTHFLKRYPFCLLLAVWSLGTGPVHSEELLWTQPSTELPNWVRHEVIYEVNVRQYSEEGTFAAVEADLDRIEELGVKTLWFMPIHPIGELNRKGELGSYYSIKDYREVNPEFGTKADFKSLVDAAKARGMKVILDWVGNHTAWDHPRAASHPDFYMKDVEGGFMPPPEFPDWSDVIQVEYTHPEVLDWHIEEMRYWITEFGIDGYRCDYATGIPTEFWDKLSAALLETKPDLFMLAEAEVTDHQLSAFHASYGWPMMHAFNDVAQGKQPASYLDDVLTRMRLEFPEGSDFLYVTSNHDENSWNGTVFERLGGGVEVFAVLTYVLDGIPLIYNGQEAGMDKRLEFFTRDPIDWKEHRLFDLYRTMNGLKAGHSALATGASSTRIPSTKDESVYTLLRETDSGKVLLVANLTAADEAVSLGSRAIAGTWIDAFDGTEIELEATAEFDLKSWGYKLLIQGE